jgi:hypothetical protein
MAERAIRVDKRTFRIGRVNLLATLLLLLVLATGGYGAGRLHGQVGYRVGYRFGYRQGYFDGDRASWHRRRRDLQATVASVLTTPSAYSSDRPVATTYTSVASENAGPDAAYRPASRDWALLDTDQFAGTQGTAVK